MISERERRRRAPAVKRVFANRRSALANVLNSARRLRLRLNQIINNLVGDVKTKDLLILDEPTDGFSTEQLDRVRVVLDELNIKQVIIVSHEVKVESFVDNVLRFEKKNGVSGVVG